MTSVLSEDATSKNHLGRKYWVIFLVGCLFGGLLWLMIYVWKPTILHPLLVLLGLSAIVLWIVGTIGILVYYYKPENDPGKWDFLSKQYCFRYKESREPACGKSYPSAPYVVYESRFQSQKPK